MITLGSFDAGTSEAARTAYLKQLQSLTRVALPDVVAGVDRLAFAAYTPEADQPMTVAQVQAGLTRAGFFPGGVADGICGYRTLSAIRLFQEYVRSVERLDVIPRWPFWPRHAAAPATLARRRAADNLGPGYRRMGGGHVRRG
ncbi:MAG: hypothetical protein IPF47_14620 [Gemmatimonadetes bacterium]|nr:hypothetical protein [Gemmatimonadota bacterium]